MASPYIPCDDIAKLNSTIKSLVCAVNDLTDAINGGNTPGTGSALNEKITLIGQSNYVLAWNATRIANYGLAPVINVFVKDPEGGWLWNPIQFLTDDADNPTQFTFNFGAPTDAVIVIS